MPEPEPTSPWKTLVTHLTHEDPEQLLAHPYNWRIHDGYQRDALHAVLQEIGFAGAILVNDRTGHVLDGHLRVDLAIQAGAQTVPVLHLNATEEEEQTLLATYDPLGALAHADREVWAELTREVTPKTDPLKLMLTNLALTYRPGTVSDSFTHFKENRDSDDDDDDEPDGDAPLPRIGSSAPREEPWATSTLTYAVTAEQRATIQQAIRGQRRSTGAPSAAVALAEICQAYLDGDI